MFGETTEKMKIIPISNDELDRVSDKIYPEVLTDFNIDNIKWWYYSIRNSIFKKFSYI